MLKWQKTDLSDNNLINSPKCWRQVFSNLPASVKELKLCNNGLPQIMSENFALAGQEVLGVASNVTKLVLSHNEIMMCQKGELKSFLYTYFPNVEKIGVINRENVRSPYKEISRTNPYFLWFIESYSITSRDLNKGYGTFTSCTVRNLQSNSSAISTQSYK